MVDNRPDPDLLLARVSAAEAKRTRGSLKVFFGACAGVGKTYAMLEAAQARRAEGIDVVVGWVETHGRPETEALLDGLEILPARELSYRGIALREIDLDAALERRPALILVDELAHTNAPGSRHAKRWRDVAELLDAGIDVYSTLNVQHVESLNDVVAQITGVKVRETVPDRVVEEAELKLVDLPPEELLKRLTEGKVYLPQQAEAAAEQLLPRGQPHRAPRARPAPGGRAGRRRDAALPHGARHRRALAGGGADPGSGRGQPVRRAPGAGGTAHGGEPAGGVDRAPRGDRSRGAVAGSGPGAAPPHADPGRAARSRGGHPERRRHGRGDPGLRPPPQRDQDRGRQALRRQRLAALARLARRPADPVERRDRRLRHQRRAAGGAAQGRAGAREAVLLASLGVDGGSRRRLHPGGRLPCARTSTSPA